MSLNIKNTLIKILTSFMLLMSLNTVAKADFLIDYHYSDHYAIETVSDDGSSQSEKNTAWKKIGSSALRQAYLKPMAFVEQKSVGSMFNEDDVHTIYFKTPFWGKTRKIHITLIDGKRIKVLQNKRTYNTLWPPGHFLGN